MGPNRRKLYAISVCFVDYFPGAVGADHKARPGEGDRDCPGPNGSSEHHAAMCGYGRGQCQGVLRCPRRFFKKGGTCSMTSGSKSLSCTNQAFTQSAVGAEIFVAEASGLGGTLHTTIASVTDGNHVTLATQAGRTVSNVNTDWGFDDTAALTNAYVFRSQYSPSALYPWWSLSASRTELDPWSSLRARSGLSGDLPRCSCRSQIRGGSTLAR